MSGTTSQIQIKIGNILFRYRSYTLIPVALVILIFSKPFFFLGNIEQEHFLFFFGLLVALFGQGIRIFTQGYAPAGTSSWGDKLEAGDLNTAGIYARVRNPLYIGNFFILLGLLIIYNSLSGYLIGIGFFSLQSWFIVQAEENFLKDKFGQKYREYCQKVPRFFPRLKKIGINQPFNWLRVLKKEQDSFAGLLVYALVLEIYKIVVNNGFRNSKKEIFNLTICLLIVILIFSGLKFWKKMRDRKSLASL
jgi:protein-S-isoprenylcysteine O-methyltransferase Ste14